MVSGPSGYIPPLNSHSFSCWVLSLSNSQACTTLWSYYSLLCAVHCTRWVVCFFRFIHSFDLSGGDGVVLIVVLLWQMYFCFCPFPWWWTLVQLTTAWLLAWSALLLLKLVQISCWYFFPVSSQFHKWIIQPRQIHVVWLCYLVLKIFVMTQVGPPFCH